MKEAINSKLPDKIANQMTQSVEGGTTTTLYSNQHNPSLTFTDMQANPNSNLKVKAANKEKCYSTSIQLKYKDSTPYVKDQEINHAKLKIN